MLYLQPYSPDMNPIEQETQLRGAAARTRQALEQGIAQLLDFLRPLSAPTTSAMAAIAAQGENALIVPISHY